MNNTKQGRWPLIKDAIIFQLKLGMDAIRDLLLSPISIVCLVVDLIKGHSQQQSYFHRLMAFGHQTDKWLNLFGSNSTTTNTNDFFKKKNSDPNVDQLFDKIETLLKEQHNKGGVTAAAKASIDRYLDKMVKKDNSVNKKESIGNIAAKPKE
ncbi:MAG: hypothetical protein HRT52_05035 [Colwellia sp.]|nr:hypothetical protein [Colwellia sp.]